MPVRRSSRGRQQGQVIIVGLAFVIIALASLLLLYQSGRLTNDKIQVVNAADAAAYSGGVWAARQLNFMAHTNRAIVANTLFQGHYTAYVAWVRYIKAITKNLRELTRPIPYANVVGLVLDAIAEVYLVLTEVIGIPVISLLEMSNAMLLTNQAMIAYTALPMAGQVMQQVGQAHHSRGRAVTVAGPGSDTRPTIPAPFDQVARDIVAAEDLRMRNMVSFYRPGILPGDDGRYERVVAATIVAMGALAPAAKNWITARTKFKGPVVDQVNALQAPLSDKAGYLIKTPLEGSTAYTTSDPMTLGLFNYWEAKHGWNEIAGIELEAGGQKLGISGRSFSTEFGFMKNTLLGYFDLGGQNTNLQSPGGALMNSNIAPLGNLTSVISLPSIPTGLPDPPGGSYQMSLTAFATLKPDHRSTVPTLGSGKSVSALHAASRAVVYYERPPGFGPLDCSAAAGTVTDCFATLFNPFWTVRLVAGPFDAADPTTPIEAPRAPSARSNAVTLLDAIGDIHW